MKSWGYNQSCAQCQGGTYLVITESISKYASPLKIKVTNNVTRKMSPSFDVKFNVNIFYVKNLAMLNFRC